MHDNVFWKAFLVVVFLCAVGYTTVASYKYYNYARLTAKAQVSSTKWDVYEKSAEDFLLTTRYTFEVDAKDYQGEHMWDEKPFLNQWAAQESIKERKKETLVAWYDPSDPDHSTLQKHFPFKEWMYSFFLWGLLLYFLWLGSYVATHRGQ